MSIYLEGVLLWPTGIRLEGRVPKMTFMSKFMGIQEVRRRQCLAVSLVSQKRGKARQVS